MSNFSDVADFHRKFGVPVASYPRLLAPTEFEFRHRFQLEEANEFADAQHAGDLVKAADALIDLVYVAMGTALMMGLPWEQLWEAVHKANMEKQRVVSQQESEMHSGRGHVYDVIKPPGWIAPTQLQEYIIKKAISDYFGLDVENVTLRT